MNKRELVIKEIMSLDERQIEYVLSRLSEVRSEQRQADNPADPALLPRMPSLAY